MTRIAMAFLKSAALIGLAVLFCTKVPSDLGKLPQNIGGTLLVSPIDGSTDNVLAPRLSWLLVPGATGYDVQVSTASDFSSTAVDTQVADTFAMAAGLSYKTIYYWRVRAHDAASFSEWTTHRIFTTIVEPLKPSVALPKDSATSLPTAIVLVWNSAGGAASYFVQVASDSGFATIVAVDSTLSDTSKLISGLSNNTTYYWRVKSRNPGGASAWTSTRRFTTIVGAPVSPLVVSPANGAPNQQLSVALTWNKVPEATGYYVQVATDIAFANVFFQDTGLTDTTSCFLPAYLSGKLPVASYTRIHRSLE
jgi:hypothetical protein